MEQITSFLTAAALLLTLNACNGDGGGGGDIGDITPSCDFADSVAFHNYFNDAKWDIEAPSECWDFAYISQYGSVPSFVYNYDINRFGDVFGTVFFSLPNAMGVIDTGGFMIKKINGVDEKFYMLTGEFTVSGGYIDFSADCWEGFSAAAPCGEISFKRL